MAILGPCAVLWVARRAYPSWRGQMLTGAELRCRASILVEGVRVWRGMRFRGTQRERLPAHFASAPLQTDSQPSMSTAPDNSVQSSLFMQPRGRAAELMAGLAEADGSTAASAATGSQTLRRLTAPPTGPRSDVASASRRPAGPGVAPQRAALPDARPDSTATEDEEDGAQPPPVFGDLKVCNRCVSRHHVCVAARLVSPTARGLRGCRASHPVIASAPSAPYGSNIALLPLPVDLESV
jgi:hypothetical protein